MAIPGLSAIDIRLRYRDLLDSAPYDDVDVQAKIDAAVDQWQRLACVALAPTTTTTVALGSGSSALALPWALVRSVSACTIAGAAVDPGSLTVNGTVGIVYRDTGAWSGPVSITYEHGYDHPPGAVVDAVMQRAVELIVPSNMPARVTSVANDLGFSRYSLAGKDGSTGIPDFDATVAQYGFAVGFA